MKNSLVCILSICALSACSTHEIDLAYYCEPSGAVVFEEGMGEVGTCPVTLKYNNHDVAISDGAIHTQKVKVIWASGATVLMPPTTVPLRADGKASVTFMRPPDYPRAEKDQQASIAYESSLMPEAVKYVVSPNQDSDGFAALDNGVTCAWDELINAVYAECQ